MGVAMRSLHALVTFALPFSGLSVLAEECSSPPLVEIIQEFSEATGVQFILDPRVNAKVSIVGRESLQSDSATLLGILLVHGFEAYESNGVVYVVPEVSGKNIGTRLGEPWRG
jgi:type II secretory pathway component GspD/PulD (secretin)